MGMRRRTKQQQGATGGIGRVLQRKINEALDEWRVQLGMAPGQEQDTDEWTAYHEFRKRTDPPPWGSGLDDEAPVGSSGNTPNVAAKKENSPTRR